MVSGIHHITGITRKIQANVDFYVGFLGLRLVKPVHDILEQGVRNPTISRNFEGRRVIAAFACGARLLRYVQSSKLALAARLAVSSLRRAAVMRRALER